MKNSPVKKRATEMFFSRPSVAFPTHKKKVIELEGRDSLTMPHAQLVSSAAARRLRASTASTSERSSTSIAASASLLPRPPRSRRLDAAAATSTAATTLLCRHHRRRRLFLSGSPPLPVPPVQRGPLPPRAVKKTFASFDDMIEEVREKTGAGKRRKSDATKINWPARRRQRTTTSFSLSQ